MMQTRERDLECSATDASHVAFENRQVVGDVKAIPQLANRRARAGADGQTTTVQRALGHPLFTQAYKLLKHR